MNKSLGVVMVLMGLLLSGQSLAEDKQSGLGSEEFEMDSWATAKEINTVEAYEVYLSEYANGRHAKYAQAAINKIKKSEHAQEPEAIAGRPANQGEASKPNALSVAQQIPSTDSAAVQKPVPAAVPVPVAAPAAAAPTATAPAAAENKAAISINSPAPTSSIPASAGEKARAQ